MDKVKEILEQHKSETPSEWLKSALERKFRNKEERKETIDFTLSVLDKMDELSITAEHLAMDLDVELELLRGYLSGKKKYPTYLVRLLSDYLKIDA